MSLLGSLSQFTWSQTLRKAPASKGPRALGLLQLAPNGKAYLIPVTILYGGQYYDGSAYKASPVPMTLDSGTVYEGVESGVSAGLFTVTDALQKPQSWVGEGRWTSAAELKAAADKKKAAKTKSAGPDPDAPPTLHRGPARAASPQPATAPSTSSTPTASGAPPPATSSPEPAKSPEKAEDKKPETTAEVDPNADPDRPTLRRGKPEPLAESSPIKPEPAATISAKTAEKSAPVKAVSTANLKLIPAISDAASIEPRPYLFEMKPEEEQQFRQKMLALASEELRTRVTKISQATIGAAATPHRKASSKTSLPAFENVQLKVFDLANSNEPVLILSAESQPSGARTPAARPVSPTGDDIRYFVLLVAKQDIYGDLHKIFSAVTDSRHLDAQARMELIDAVDADGDGHGELLFRRITDAGTAFDLFRVIGYQLWPLFQGTPTEP